MEKWQIYMPIDTVDTVDTRSPPTTMARAEARESTGCPACKSGDTVRTDSTLVREARYCFTCRRRFDVELVRPDRRRRAADQRC